MQDIIKSAKADGFKEGRKCYNQEDAEKKYVGYLSWRIDMLTANKISSIEDAKPYIYMMQRFMPYANFEKFYVDTYNPRNKFNRPEWNKLMESCNEGQIDIIVIPSIKTLSISISEIIEITRKLKSLPKPVHIYFLAELLGSDADSFEMACQLLLTMYQEQENFNKRRRKLTAYIKECKSRIAIEKLNNKKAGVK